jgi:hypothetical protein
MITTATVTSKGLLTPLSKKLRDQLGVHEGERVRIRVEKLEAKPYKKKVTLDDVGGFLEGKSPIKHATLEEMDKAVEEAFRRGEL